MCLLPRDPRLPGRVVLHYGSLHLPESGEKQRNKGKILWVFFFLISVFPVPEKKWLNGRESDSKPPYSAEVQKGWRFISTHCYVCVLWCYSFVSFLLISVFPGQKSGWIVGKRTANRHTEPRFRKGGSLSPLTLTCVSCGAVYYARSKYTHTHKPMIVRV